MTFDRYALYECRGQVALMNLMYIIVLLKVKVISTFVLATFTFQTGSYHFQMAVFSLL